MSKHYGFGLGSTTRLLILVTIIALIWYTASGDSRIDQEKFIQLLLIFFGVVLLVVVMNLNALVRYVNSIRDSEPKVNSRSAKTKDGPLVRVSVTRPTTPPYSNTKEISGILKNGKLHGFVQEFDSHGFLVAAGNFDEGKRHGLWKFYQYGNPLAKGCFKNGLQDGIWKIFTPLEERKVNGPEFIIEETYDNGVIVDGDWLSYWSNGYICERGGYQNGLKHGLWERFSPEYEGAIWTRSMFNHGVLFPWHIEYTVDDKGVSRKKREFNWEFLPKYEGSAKLYDGYNERLVAEGMIINGVKAGKWKLYWPEKKEVTYINGYREWSKIKILNETLNLLPSFFRDDNWDFEIITNRYGYNYFRLDDYYSDDWNFGQ